MIVRAITAGLDHATQPSTRFRRKEGDRFIDRGRRPGRHLVDAAHFVRPDHAALCRVMDPATDMRNTAGHLQQPRIEPGFAPAPHLLGHVLDRAQVARAGIVREQPLGACMHMPHLTRWAHDPVVDIEPCPGTQCRVHRVAHALALVRVHDLQEVVDAIRSRPDAVNGAGPVR
jgi:hypothetical protein